MWEFLKGFGLHNKILKIHLALRCVVGQAVNRFLKLTFFFLRLWEDRGAAALFIQLEEHATEFEAKKTPHPLPSRLKSCCCVSVLLHHSSKTYSAHSSLMNKEKNRYSQYRYMQTLNTNANTLPLVQWRKRLTIDLACGLTTQDERHFSSQLDQIKTLPLWKYFLTTHKPKTKSNLLLPSRWQHNFNVLSVQWS